MNTLTYGRKQPETGDDSQGATGWMDALSDNVALDDSHSHNGTDSSRLDSRAINSHTITTGTSWNLIAEGLYSMTVSMPSGLDFDKYVMVFKDSNGQQAFLDVIKINASSFTVKTNDNSMNYTVYFLS